MPRPALVPPELKKGPFTLEDAHSAGLSRWHLQTSAYRRLGPKLYAWSGLGDSTSLKLAAVRLRLPPSVVFSGLTAAWLHGVADEAGELIDVTIESTWRISARAGLRVRRTSLADRDITTRADFRVTTVERMLSDLCIDHDPTEVVVISDVATHRGIITTSELAAYADRCRGRAGITMLRRVIGFTEPKAESPMESRLRMLMVTRGLPRPLVQVPLYGRANEFLGRPDMYYPDQKLAIEYDGGIHKASMVEDNRRQNALLAEGIHVLRFTASDVYQHPDRMVEQVRRMLFGGASKPPVPEEAAHRDRVSTARAGSGGLSGRPG